MGNRGFNAMQRVQRSRFKGEPEKKSIPEFIGSLPDIDEFAPPAGSEPRSTASLKGKLPGIREACLSGSCETGSIRLFRNHDHFFARPRLALRTLRALRTPTRRADRQAAGQEGNRCCCQQYF